MGQTIRFMLNSWSRDRLSSEYVQKARLQETFNRDWVARVYFPNRYFHIHHNGYNGLQWLFKNLGGQQGAIRRI